MSKALLNQWLNNRTIDVGQVRAAAAHVDYEAFCKALGAVAINKDDFTDELEKQGYTKIRLPHGYMLPFTLRSEAFDPDSLDEEAEEDSYPDPVGELSLIERVKRHPFTPAKPTPAQFTIKRSVKMRERYIKASRLRVLVVIAGEGREKPAPVSRKRVYPAPVLIARSEVKPVQANPEPVVIKDLSAFLNQGDASPQRLDREWREAMQEKRSGRRTAKPAVNVPVEPVKAPRAAPASLDGILATPSSAAKGIDKTKNIPCKGCGGGGNSGRLIRSRFGLR